MIEVAVILTAKLPNGKVLEWDWTHLSVKDMKQLRQLVKEIEKALTEVSPQVWELHVARPTR